MQTGTTSVLLGTFLLASLSGCGGGSRTRGDYSTVDRDDLRNAEKAAEYNREAVRLIREGKLEEAETELSTALSYDITHGPAHNNLGKVYYHQGKLYLAAWEFQYSAKLMPNHPEPKNNLGLVFEKVGKLEEASEQYGMALELEEDNPVILGNLARTRVRRGERSEELKELLREVVMKDRRPDWIDWARRELMTMTVEPQDRRHQKGGTP